MNKIFLLLFLISTFSNAQNYKKIDAIVSQYPNFNSAEKLASKIENDFNLDSEKVRAAFFWLINNIKYTEKNSKLVSIPVRIMYYSEEERELKFREIKDNLIKKMFISKEGVCEHYAQSFKKICDLLKIKSYLVKGYVRSSANEIGKTPKTKNHIWNAIIVNNEKTYLDATWAAGSFINNHWKKKFKSYYYNINSKQIRKTHFTFLKKTSIRLARRKIQAFYNQPIYGYTFLEKKLELITQKKGEIHTNGKKYITLKVKNLTTNTEIHYNYKGYKYSKKAKVKHKENIAYIKIRSPKKSTNLFLFFDKKLGLQYKILID